MGEKTTEKTTEAPVVKTRKPREAHLDTQVKNCLGFLKDTVKTSAAIVITEVPENMEERLTFGLTQNTLTVTKGGKGTLVVTKA